MARVDAEFVFTVTFLVFIVDHNHKTKTEGSPTLICLFMVMQKSMMKYITRMGQNTGTLKASKNVQIMAMTMPFVAECLMMWKQNTHFKCNPLKNNTQMTSSVLYGHNVFMVVHVNPRLTGYDITHLIYFVD